MHVLYHSVKAGLLLITSSFSFTHVSCFLATINVTFDRPELSSQWFMWVHSFSKSNLPAGTGLVL